MYYEKMTDLEFLKTLEDTKLTLNDIEHYRKMSFQELLEKFLSYYQKCEVHKTGTKDEKQLYDLMHCEIFEFRGDLERVECKQKMCALFYENQRKIDELEGATVKTKDEEFLKKLNVGQPKLDHYHQLSFSNLLNEYISLYILHNVIESCSVSGSIEETIMRREIFGFRSQAEKDECLKRIDEIDRNKDEICRKFNEPTDQEFLESFVNPKITMKEIDYYRKLGISELVEKYHFIPDNVSNRSELESELFDLIERELVQFRSEAEQKEFWDMVRKTRSK